MTTTSATPLISCAEFAILHDGATHDMLIIDCRFDLANPQTGAIQYAQGHIPGAVFLDLDHDLCGIKTGYNGRHPLPDREAFAEKLRKLGVNDNTLIIAYDQKNSMFAAHLWWMMLWLGHPAVRVLDGGLSAWERQKGALTQDITPPRTPGKMQLRPALTPTIDASSLRAQLGTSSLYLIDARAPQRYRGEVEPLDPAAGHIPGAINHFFELNLQPDGTFKPVNELRALWTQTLHGHSPQNTVHQCGSGVSACHNLLAMVQAEFPITTIYPGSWSEWCADPTNPIAQSA